jgi:hypothetical protein
MNFLKGYIQQFLCCLYRQDDLMDQQWVIVIFACMIASDYGENMKTLCESNVICAATPGCSDDEDKLPISVIKK